MRSAFVFTKRGVNGNAGNLQTRTDNNNIIPFHQYFTKSKTEKR